MADQVTEQGTQIEGDSTPSRPYEPRPTGGELATPDDRILVEQLRARGVTDDRKLPAVLRDKIIAQSRRGPVGRIVIKKFSGIVNSAAARVLRTFERNVGGLEEIADKLSAIEGELSDTQRALLDVLRDPSNKKGLNRIVAETGAEPVALMNAYSRGCLELGKVEAAIVAHRNLPAIAEEITKLALSKRGVCDACGGGGMVHARPGVSKDTKVCSWCEGKGIKEADKLKSFGIDRFLEITGQRVRAPMVQVNQGVQVKMGGSGGSIFERMINATDKVLYRKEGTSQPEIVEAEVVQS